MVGSRSQHNTAASRRRSEARFDTSGTKSLVDLPDMTRLVPKVPFKKEKVRDEGPLTAAGVAPTA
jgi:hypothetical protein